MIEYDTSLYLAGFAFASAASWAHVLGTCEGVSSLALYASQDGLGRHDEDTMALIHPGRERAQAGRGDACAHAVLFGLNPRRRGAGDQQVRGSRSLSGFGFVFREHHVVVEVSRADLDERVLLGERGDDRLEVLRRRSWRRSPGRVRVAPAASGSKPTLVTRTVTLKTTTKIRRRWNNWSGRPSERPRRPAHLFSAKRALDASCSLQRTCYSIYDRDISGAQGVGI